MSNKTIKVDYLARVEGEGALYVKISGDKVTDVKLKIFEPPRFFEAFLRGRKYSEAPDITARICGICPVAYQMSAVHAMEHAFGVVVERATSRAAQAALLRRVDREPHAACLYAACARFSRLSRCYTHGAGLSRRRQAWPPDEKGGQCYRRPSWAGERYIPSTCA